MQTQELDYDALLDDLVYGDVGGYKDDPVGWIQKQFVIPELKAPMILAPYHQAVLREAYRRGDDGHYIYSTVVWSDIKKSIKSSIAAAVVLHRAFHTPYGMFKIVANDLKQADSRVAFYARRAVELNPRLSARAKVINYRLTIDNRAFVEAIPVDPKGEAGGNDDLICFSELWAANQTAALRMWTEATLSPTKFGESQRWVETYAGFSGESPLLEQLYYGGVREGRKIDLSFTDETGTHHDLKDLEVYANDAKRMLVLWNDRPRCEWQTNADGQAYYAQEAAILTPEEFNRVHRNQWAAASSPFLPIEWWDACKTDDLNPLGRYQSVVVGIDAATTNDSFAIVTVSRTLDVIEVRECRVWYPQGHKLDFSEPENYLRELAQKYHVACFAYDAYQLHDMTQRLSREGLGYFFQFNQNALRAVADKHLYDIIRDKRIVHNGDQKELRDAISNAARKQVNVDGRDMLRIVKRAEHLKIDATVALSQACERAAHLNIGADSL